MSHGSQAEKAKLVEAIRALEKELHRPTTILFDLQGPKLRVGKFEGGSAMLERGPACSCSTATTTPGDATRVELPHPELFEAVEKDDRLLIDDGKIRLRVAAVERGPDRRGGRGRRQGQQQQGRQRPRRAGADPGADRQGSRGPAVRARAGRRLDRLVLRPAARGRRRSARRWSATRRRCWPRSRSRRRSSGSTRSSSWPTR